jgi:hypothetical protein
LLLCNFTFFKLLKDTSHSYSYPNRSRKENTKEVPKSPPKKSINMSNVVLPSNFKIENVSFKEPKKNTVGGQSVLLNYTYPDKKNGPLIMQTPKMRMPFGPDAGDTDTGAKKYSINTTLANDDNPNQNLQVFTEIIRSLDQKTKDFAAEHSELWFGKTQKPEVLEEFYKSAEKKSKNDKYPSTLKLKLPVKAGDKPVPQFDIYNDNKELVNIVEDGGIDLSCLQKGGEVVAIIQCTGVWFVGKTQFGLGWKVVQLKTFKNQKLVGYSIIDDDPEEEVEEEEEEEEEVEVEEEEEIG